MSLINQVLNDLEKRGAGDPAGSSSIRPVPVQTRWGRTIAIAGGGAALLALAWLGGNMLLRVPAHEPQPVASTLPSRLAAIQPVVSQPVAVMQPQSAIAASATLEAPVVATTVTRLSAELASASQPVAHGNTVIANQEDPPKKHAQQSVVAARKKAAARPASVAVIADKGGVPIKQISPQQQAEDEFSQALMLIQQGRKSEAQRHLEATLKLNPAQNQARQALTGLLLESKRHSDAERVLQDGLRNDPKQAGFAMLLARMQVERGALTQALETLQKTLPYAEEQADYQAFVAAVLQRQNYHDEAIQHYQAALRQSPNSGVWLMGLGISLQAVKRNEEAREAFRRAMESHSLSAELQDFVGR